MTDIEGHTPTRLARAAGFLLVACGLMLPVIAVALEPSLLVNDTVWLTLVLGALGAASSRIAIRFSHDDDAPIFDPSSGPIVVAAIACTPIQAMFVVLMTDLIDIRAIRRKGIRTAAESAGIGSVAVGITSLLVQAAAFSLDVPWHIVLVAITASALFLAVDGIIYTTWYHFESRSAAAVVEFMRTAAPTDLVLTLGAVIFTLPFVGNTAFAAIAMGAYQLGVFAVGRMAASESMHREQSEFLAETFSRYVPRTVAEQLASREGDLNLGGQTREVTVLFCDIRGFTSWAEQNDAEVVITELNDLLGPMAAAVLRHEGTLDKYLGDGLMAFWGSPLEQPDHARMACDAAISLLDAVRQVNKRRVAQGIDQFEIGVGIATGQVVVGNVGHENRLEYTVIGDTVNLSARLESSTRELDMPIVIDMPTALEIMGHETHAAVDLGEIAVKGKADPVSAFGLISVAELDSMDVEGGAEHADNERDTLQTPAQSQPGYVQAPKSIPVLDWTDATFSPDGDFELGDEGQAAA